MLQPNQICQTSSICNSVKPRVKDPIVLPLTRWNSLSLLGGSAHQLTRSLTTVRDSTVSSRLGQGTTDWGTMSLSSLLSPEPSGSARSFALPSAPGTTPGPSTPVGTEAGGLSVLPDPLSSPKPSRPSGAAPGSPFPSTLTLSTLISLF